ncbi:acetyltransferase [Thalassotalea insulae]|uniref:Acetyltransferase n=1 Tax=Thalassotalea insulae TaxID=2056778 RepID=A0ABQ6GSH1_9GAMM|nr:GNAT family N-acetyltransferase [Thalassotalea insulae]GLX78554.1 acetyltransferase [Thalassotalea insulae]
MKITNYSSAYAKAIAELFYQAVHAIDASVYSEQQKQAWAPAPIDYQKWQQRLAIKQPLVALIDNQVAGFIELDPDGHIDCTYVLPKFQGRGVASTLIKYLLSKAQSLGLTELYVEASIIAKPVFEKLGFVVEQENSVVRNNTLLTNYSMRLMLPATANA